MKFLTSPSTSCNTTKQCAKTVTAESKAIQYVKRESLSPLYFKAFRASILHLIPTITKEKSNLENWGNVEHIVGVVKLPIWLPITIVSINWEPCKEESKTSSGFWFKKFMKLTVKQQTDCSWWIQRDTLKHGVWGETPRGVLSPLGSCDALVLTENARNNQSFPFFPMVTSDNLDSELHWFYEVSRSSWHGNSLLLPMPPLELFFNTFTGSSSQ